MWKSWVAVSSGTGGIVLDAGGQRVATAAVGEGDDVAVALGFDCGLIDLVGVAPAEMEGGGLDGGGLHNLMGLVGFGGEGERKRPPRRVLCLHGGPWGGRPALGRVVRRVLVPLTGAGCWVIGFCRYKAA